MVGAALVTEIVFQPPYWVHAALWLPLIVLVTLGPLRPMKSLMIALQYNHQAAESRFGQAPDQVVDQVRAQENAKVNAKEPVKEHEREHPEP